MATDDAREIKTVVLLFAMEAEAQPTIARLGLSPKGPFAPPLACLAYEGNLHGARVVLVVNGTDPTFGVSNVGTVAAALTAHAACAAFSPDLLISAGTAGGFSARGGAIGDVYVATAFVNHDRRIAIPGFTEYGVYKTDAHDASAMAAALGLKLGVCSSGNSLESADADLEQLKASGAAVKEMEAAGIAYVARAHAVPMVALKAVTDIVDGDKPTHEEFLENLHAASAAIEKAVAAALEYVAGKRLTTPL